MHAQAAMHACNPALLLVILFHFQHPHNLLFTLFTLYYCCMKVPLTEHFLLLLLHNESAPLAKYGGKAFIVKQSEEIWNNSDRNQSSKMHQQNKKIEFWYFLEGRSVLNIAGSNGSNTMWHTVGYKNTPFYTLRYI